MIVREFNRGDISARIQDHLLLDAMSFYQDSRIDKDRKVISPWAVHILERLSYEFHLVSLYLPDEDPGFFDRLKGIFRNKREVEYPLVGESRVLPVEKWSVLAHEYASVVLYLGIPSSPELVEHARPVLVPVSADIRVTRSMISNHRVRLYSATEEDTTAVNLRRAHFNASVRKGGVPRFVDKFLR